MIQKRFTADIETMLYIASALCVAVAIGILVMPHAMPQSRELAGNIIDATAIEAISPLENVEAEPGRLTPPMQLDTTLGETTTDPSELVIQGKQALDKGNGRQALDLLLRAKDGGKDSPDLQAMIAESYNNIRNFDQAAEVSSAILRDNPGHTAAKVAFATARIHQAGNNNQEALMDEAASLLQTIPQDHKAIFLSCIIATYKGNTEMQQQSCEMAKQGSTLDARIASDILAQRQLFSTFRDGNRSYIDLLHAKSVADASFYDLSSLMARRIVEQHRDYRDAWVVLGYDYIVMEKYSLAQVALETAYQLDTTKAHIQYLLGIAYDKQQQKEKAVSYYMLALDNQYPNKTALRQRIALLLADLQKFDLALKQYVALVDENALSAPEMYVTPIWISLEYVKDLATAQSLAQKAKEKFPDSAVSDNLLGWVALNQGSLVEAETFLKTSIEKNENYDAPWYNLGRVYEAQQKPTEAREAYRRAYTVGNNSQIARLAAENFNRLSSQQ